MEWSLPPGRAGRAPQASRHSNSAEVVLGVAPVANVAAGFGVEGGVGPVADAETEPVCVLLEQALTTDATLTLPASWSS